MTLTVDRQRVLAFRARASHLDERLSVGSFATAAAGGLQDSAPRAAVISLHARVEHVEPSSWEDPSLAQIWGPRAADYVVPRADVGVFTLGRLPRDPEQRLNIDTLGDDVIRALDGRTRSGREVSEALPDHGHMIRLSAITGRVLIRWDASRIDLIPVDAPDMDPEDARRELARRFLRWLGPATAARFSWWAGIEPADATETWRALGSELIEVELDGLRRSLLHADEDALVGAQPVRGVRLLPHGDPLIKIDEELIVPDAAHALEVFPHAGTKSAFWPVSGGVLVDGAFVGSFARQQRKVTVHLWHQAPGGVREAIEAEAISLPIAGKTKPAVKWAY